MQDYFVKQLGVSLLVYIGYLIIGYGFSWTAPIIPKLQDVSQTPLTHLVTDTQASWVASLFYVGALLGPYPASYLSNKYGRRPTLVLGGLVLVVAYAILAAAVNLAMVYTGRIIIGFGNAILAVACLIYLGEIASANIRGAVLTGAVLSTSVGMLLVYSIGPFVSYSSVFYIGLALIAAFICGTILAPESPVFYVIKGREEDARKSMAVLGRTDEAEISEVLSRRDTEWEAEGSSGWKDLIYIKSNRKAMFICVGISILQQLTGITVVAMLSTTIFEKAGSTIEPNLATIFIGLTQLGAGTLALIIIEKSGRRVLLLGSSVFSFMGLTILGLYFFLESYNYDVLAVGWVPLASLVIYLVAFNMGLGIIPLTLIGEMFTSKARSTGSSFALTIGWLFSFGTVTAFGYVVSAIGAHYMFWGFAIAAIAAFWFSVFFIPETRGKTLCEIQDMLK